MNDQALSILVLAYGLDLLLGDPRWLPHPVRWMGFAIDRGETILRKCIGWEYLAGGLLVLLVVGGSYSLSWFVIKTCFSFSWFSGLAVSIFLLYACLSTRDLDVESREVFKALKTGDIRLSRAKVSMIVGRDTDPLDEEGIVRSTVETVAENTVDGVISPLGFAVLGGVPLAVAYRAVNTLDAMIGHKTERYLKFGRVAAKIDDWANWIPARLSGILFPLAAGLCGFSLVGSFKTAWTDGIRNAHSNSGIPEASMAGALGVQLGGGCMYKGTPVSTPHLGQPLRPLRPETVLESIRVMYFCSALTFLIALTLKVIWLRLRAS